MLERIGGRKAAACLTGLAVIVGCFLLKGNLPQQLIDGVQFLVTTYVAGNIGSDVVQAVSQHALVKAENVPAQEAPPAIDPAINQKIETLFGHLANFDRLAGENFRRIDGEVAQIRDAVGAQDTTLKQVVDILSKERA